MPAPAPEPCPPCSVGHIRPDTDIDARDAYFLELLELALRQTELDFGPCELREAPVRMSQSRAIASMKEGRFVDVIWTMTSPDREATMLPVRVPLLMGLMGVRAPVVPADRPPDTLADAATADDLRSLSAAQGHDWPANRAGLDLLDRVGDRIIWLKNPYLPEDTPVNRKVFWHQPIFEQAPPEVRPAAPVATR